MATFKVLCFSGNVLQDWEELQAPDLIECLSQVRRRAHCHRIEVWDGARRVAVLRHVGDAEKERPLRHPR